MVIVVILALLVFLFSPLDFFFIFFLLNFEHVKGLLFITTNFFFIISNKNVYFIKKVEAQIHREYTKDIPRRNI